MLLQLVFQIVRPILCVTLAVLETSLAVFVSLLGILYVRRRVLELVVFDLPITLS